MVDVTSVAAKGPQRADVQPLGAWLPPLASVWVWRRVREQIRESANYHERVGDAGVAKALRFAAEQLEAASATLRVRDDVYGRGSAGETAKPAVVLKVPPSAARVTVQEARRMLNVSEPMVRRYCAHGDLVADQPGGRGTAWVICQQSVVDFLDARRSA